MMTFLNVIDTAVCGRTCQTWLRVAYSSTPTKSFGATFSLPTSANFLDRHHHFLRSPFKRHFNKIHQQIKYTWVLEELCAAMTELTEYTFSQTNTCDEDVKYLKIDLEPLLQYHAQSLTRLTFIGVTPMIQHLKVIKQLPALITLDVLVDDWSVEVGWGESPPLKPARWRLDHFQALSDNKHKLTHLREFRFDTVYNEPLSTSHFDCFKNFLPLEAFTSITPSPGMTNGFLKNLPYFKYLRKLSLYIVPVVNNSFELMRNALLELSLLETLEFRDHHFHEGRITYLIHQAPPLLTSLIFNEVTFQSPECLWECPRQLTDLAFEECSTVRFEHLVAVGALPSLERLTHRGRTDVRTPLTKQQQQQLTPPHSLLLPSLKEFRYDWPASEDD